MDIRAVTQKKKPSFNNDWSANILELSNQAISNIPFSQPPAMRLLSGLPLRGRLS